jgi:hypothetical protein
MSKQIVELKSEQIEKVTGGIETQVQYASAYMLPSYQLSPSPTYQAPAYKAPTTQAPPIR